MSRGLGKIERKIIEELKKMKLHKSYKIEWKCHTDLKSLVYYVFDLYDEISEDNSDKPTQSQYISTWHAVKSLEKKGIVETKREWDNFRLYHGIKGGATTCLLVRLKS